MKDTIIVWKFTKKDGKPAYGARPLRLPKNGKPGAWHNTGAPPVICSHGVHGCRTLRDALVGSWLNEWLWVAELRGPFEEDLGNKVAGRSGRLLYRVETWNDQTARLFAADCAEAVLHLANDPSCDAAVLAARRYAFGLIDDVARDAAWNAVRAVDLDVARDAARNAARVVARAVAWDAARNAAWAVARDAARVAARAVARDAARDAAWNSARVVAQAVAWDAARNAAFDTQATRLHAYLTGSVDLEAIKRSVS